MFEYTTSTDMRENWQTTLIRLRAIDGPMFVLGRSKPVAVVVSIETWKKIEQELNWDE